jgi:hypothetical protein
LSDRPYAADEASPSKPCPETTLDFSEPPPPKFRRIGVAGMGGGAAVLGLAGVFWVAGRYAPDSGSQGFDNTVSIVLALVGGIMFLAGAGAVLYDTVVTPAPSPGGQGAQLIFAGRF